MSLPKILKDLLSLPTAAFVEDAVMAYVVKACEKLSGVSYKFDRYGNLLAHYRYRPRGVPPVVFTAHTDHPGFVAAEMKDDVTLHAHFRGWVESKYFVGTKVRFWSGGGWIKGEVTKLVKTAPVYRPIGQTSRPEEVLIRVRKPVEAGSPGMWDLPEPALRGDRVTARGQDDMAGVAAMVALLDRLSKKQKSGEAYCLFTRAEEVGFVGAIGACKARTLSKKNPIVAIETSKELPNARIGDGPILRVGDKMSIFTPGVTAFCDRVCKVLQKRRKTFAYQRKLMDGGSCESTAYVAYGYPATGVCLALGNYHNMDTRREKIASEYISLKDWKRMVDMFEALVLDEEGYGDESGGVRADLDKRFDSLAHLL